MTITIKLSKNIKVQKYSKGLKFFLIYKKKWIIIKLTKNQVRLLQYVLNLFIGKKNEK